MLLPRFSVALLFSANVLGMAACGDTTDSDSTGGTSESGVSTDATEPTSSAGNEDTSTEITSPDDTVGVNDSSGETSAPPLTDADTDTAADTTGDTAADTSEDGVPQTATDTSGDTSTDSSDLTTGSDTSTGASEDGTSESESDTTDVDTGTPVDPSTMVLVPSGSFVMGCNSATDAECLSDELPAHTVAVASFLIDQTEVTVAEYAECVAASECAEPATGPDNNWQVVGRELHPINGVTWFDADSYCGYVGKRLPTEAEWEYAARGNDGRIFTWGATLPSCSLANSDSGCADGTTVIGQYPSGAGPYKTLDMAGNVTEWVNDWYDATYYSVAGSNDPAGPATGTSKVVRGSAWNFFPDSRASKRASVAPDSGGPAIGFRCAQ